LSSIAEKILQVFRSDVIETLADYYRLPAETLGGLSLTAAPRPGAEGFFHFGASNVCYGRSSSGTSPDVGGAARFDAIQHLHKGATSIQLPFDFAEVTENLRLERYRSGGTQGLEALVVSEPVRKLYYWVRSTLPFVVRRQLQKIYFRDWKDLPFPAWPVDFTVDNLHRQVLRLLLETTGIKSFPSSGFGPRERRVR
jgi:hypothetical protein